MLDIKKDIQEAKNIIKALKICSSDYVDEEDCLECPYYIYYRCGCVEQLKENAAEKLEFFIKLQDPMGLMNKEAPNDNT